MTFVRVILLVMLALDGYWAWRADSKLRGLRRDRLWRGLAGAFAAAQAGCLLLVFVRPQAVRGVECLLPTPVLAAVYLWHLLVLPVSLLVPFAARLARTAGRLALLPARLVRRRHGGKSAGAAPPLDPAPSPAAPSPAAPSPAVPRAAGFTRRHVLSAAAVAAPMISLGGVVAAGLGQVGRFRVRRIALDVPQLPAALDGLTVAHVSDVHVGRFMRPQFLPPVVEAVNALGADLVLLTGDLIDFAVADLPPALEAVKAMRSRYGTAMCVGNHDLFEGDRVFRKGVSAAGVAMPVDESHVIDVDRNGSRERVQLLGLSWSRPDGDTQARMARLARLRIGGCFPIVLAHHPHAFDAAAGAGLPLTLSGHTHGGQLMATRRLGAGPLMFRYWSGPYTKGPPDDPSHLVVSNGVGNWFPLRINAPAEIIHLTLRRRENS